jgi:hypothetical protein
MQIDIRVPAAWAGRPRPRLPAAVVAVVVVVVRDLVRDHPFESVGDHPFESISLKGCDGRRSFSRGAVTFPWGALPGYKVP